MHTNGLQLDEYLVIFLDVGSSGDFFCLGLVNSRCRHLSIFLLDALMSISIPAAMKDGIEVTYDKDLQSVIVLWMTSLG